MKVKSPKLRGEDESGEEESELNLKKPTPGASQSTQRSGITCLFFLVTFLSFFIFSLTWRNQLQVLVNTEKWNYLSFFILSPNLSWISIAARKKKHTTSLLQKTGSSGSNTRTFGDVVWWLGSLWPIRPLDPSRDFILRGIWPLRLSRKALPTH